MYNLRKSNERGHANHGWLDSQHTFSFADYYDPRNMGFGALRVINDDRIKGGGGFPTHGHRDMEIITYVIAGALEHKDTLGTAEVLRPGEVQRMSAGSGIRHSEYNPSPTEPLHLLQIWILPEKEGIKPRYGQKKFDFAGQKDFTLVASKTGRQGSLDVNQDANIYVGHWKSGQQSELKIGSDRRAWIQMVKGQLHVDDQILNEGDGLGVTEKDILKFQAKSDSEFLVFDLP
jgi:redox-sensitive bicupin YhaK (pirin superfamily)